MYIVYITYLNQNTGIALKAINVVVSGQEFQIQTVQARKAIKSAKDILEWINNDISNMAMFQDFCTQLGTKFACCFHSGKTKRSRYELMWSEYHQLRVTNSFKMEWEKFMCDSIKDPSLPTFYQFVSHFIFKELVKQKFPLPYSTLIAHLSTITELDENSIRYVAGYICRKVQKKKHRINITST
jgi:hypothetical protein